MQSWTYGQCTKLFFSWQLTKLCRVRDKVSYVAWPVCLVTSAAHENISGCERTSLPTTGWNVAERNRAACAAVAKTSAFAEIAPNPTVAQKRDRKLARSLSELQPMPLLPGSMTSAGRTQSQLIQTPSTCHSRSRAESWSVCRRCNIPCDPQRAAV
jgi:hypothetical protein